MALSTNTILDTMEWAKRFNFNRPSGIGNLLEPAKTSANMVMQAVLSPPFNWQWNAEEVSFGTSPTPATVALTGNVSITANVITINAVLPQLGVSQIGILSGFTVSPATSLNGFPFVVLTNNGTVITGQISVTTLTSTAATGGIVTAGSTQDYTLLLPEFGHIQYASLYDISTTTPKWIEMSMKTTLALETNVARPQFICPNTQDANGNVQFRLAPAPNKAYPVALHIQKAAPLITSLNQTWAPFPDYMEYIYNQGFLSAMFTFSDDPRAPLARQQFVTHLLGRATGLTAVERNIFLNNWTDLTELEKLQLQQGVQARGA